MSLRGLTCDHENERTSCERRRLQIYGLPAYEYLHDNRSEGQNKSHNLVEGDTFCVVLLQVHCKSLKGMVHADEGPRMVPNVAVVEAESRDRSPALGSSEHFLILQFCKRQYDYRRVRGSLFKDTQCGYPGGSKTSHWHGSFIRSTSIGR